MNEILRIAIQKSGRLQEGSLQLLKETGLSFSNGKDQLKAQARNFPVEILFLRDDDIPQYVEDNVADIGFVGENVVLEKKKQVIPCEPLGFGKCRLSLAIKKGDSFTGVADLEGKRIATSYPVILGDYLKSQGVTADIHEISGSVEIAPGIGLADAICDLVSSGSTLFMNGLRETTTILQSQAVLIKNAGLPDEKEALLERLLFRIRSVKKARNHKYILLNAPNDRLDTILSLLPGMKSPTVLPLAEPGWSSVHSVLNENDFWNIIEQLRDAGAQGILVVPIEKMIV
jgi:ATP phosphoribosyltransferase